MTGNAFDFFSVNVTDGEVMNTRRAVWDHLDGYEVGDLKVISADEFGGPDKFRMNLSHYCKKYDKKFKTKTKESDQLYVGRIY